LRNNDELTLTLLRSTQTFTTQKSLADELGYSVGKINYILKALINKGFIKVENFTKSGDKKKYTYLLTQEGIKEKINLTEKFIQRKKREYEELQNELKMMKSIELSNEK
jgi:EPS-associated MarR family transcriptional regulator